MNLTEIKKKIEDINKNSKFPLSFSNNTLGVLHLQNSENSGFVIELNSIKSAFEDIKENLVIFSENKKYNEKKWRALHDKFYNDGFIRNLCKVQTKLTFTTLSKILHLAIDKCKDYNDSADLNLTEENINQILIFLDKLIEEIQALSLTPNRNLPLQTNSIIDKVFRKVVFKTFKLLLEKYGQEKVLNGHNIKEGKAGNNSFKVITLPKYFKNENLIAVFTSEDEYKQADSSKPKRFIEERITIQDNNFAYFTSQWNAVDNGRPLTLSNFNNFLNDITDGQYIIIKETNYFKLQINNIISFEDIIIQPPTNTIYYGAPGTGKSHTIEQIIKPLDKKYYERVTFHPEYDNASFIGAYKPISAKDEQQKDIIKYEFVPQAFANIYKRAWLDLDNQYYLVIEEINRGNCAEIFGDIFQLLDRNSDYTVTPSTELEQYLENELGQGHDGIKNGLKLPPNLSILATMNTSDQSLFPMDAAFKRRWDWEYIPICYEPMNEDGKENTSYHFEIELDPNNKYSWIEFIKIVNDKHIKTNLNLGMDKCLGNYFVKPTENKTITLKQFINKVIFYLWNDVFKEEENSFFDENTSYENFFPIQTNGLQKIKTLFERIGLKPIADIIPQIDDSIQYMQEQQTPLIQE